MEKKYVQKNDPVNHPAHYTKGKVECIDAIEAAVSDLNGMEAFLTGQVIKYSYRWKDKGGAEDLRKARWYLNRLINFVENQGEEHEEEPAEITVNPCPNCGCSDTGILHFSDDSTECSVMCERCNFIGMGIHEMIERLQEIEEIHPETVMAVRIRFVDGTFVVDDGTVELECQKRNQGVADIETDSTYAGQTVAVIVPFDGLY